MTGPAERARLAELARKVDAGKLVVLAAWFDMYDQRKAADRQAILDEGPGRNEVQSDLRRIAARLAALEAVASAARDGHKSYPDGGDPELDCPLCAALRALDGTEGQP